MALRGANHRLFWEEFRRTFHSTGAVLPSGRVLCRALARYVSADGPPRRILEVGPGTGVVTDEIIRRMGPNDTLDLVELNDRFVTALYRRLTEDATWQAKASQVTIYHMAVEHLTADESYDVIVSGLPLNNFMPDVVRSILERLTSIAVPGGTLSFFEYVGIRRAKALAASKSERQRLAGVAAAINQACEGRVFRRQCVLANVPPAWVHHLRF